MENLLSEELGFENPHSSQTGGQPRYGLQLPRKRLRSIPQRVSPHSLWYERTRAAFGRPINPHLFRDAAATTTAIHDPLHVRLVAPLLGHRTFSTTERHYMHAQSLEAHREFVATLTQLRQQLLSESKPDT
jgi:integrase